MVVLKSTHGVRGSRGRTRGYLRGGGEGQQMSSLRRDTEEWAYEGGSYCKES